MDNKKFFEFSDVLFEKQKEWVFHHFPLFFLKAVCGLTLFSYFDEALETKTRRDVAKELAELAGSVGVSSEKVLELLVNGTDEPKNAGNKVTNDLKLAIRIGRQNGIHVSPTLLLDGIRDDSVSSSWELDQWKEYLKSKL